MSLRLSSLCLAALAAPIASAQPTLLVSDGVGDKVVRFACPSGEALEQFVGPGLTALESAQGMCLGPDGDLYVASAATDQILRFDGRTGHPKGEFVRTRAGGLYIPGWPAFGPDGNLYVSSAGNSRVLRYDGSTGQFIDEFVPAGSGPIGFPRAIAFSPVNGDLYVASRDSNSVLRYDGSTGAFIGEVIAPGQTDLQSPQDILFDEVGTLYVAGFASNQVIALPDGGQPHALIQGGGGLSGPVGLAIGPDGTDLFVASWDSPGSVLRFDKGTGEFRGVFAPSYSGGLGEHPRDLLLLPTPCTADFNADGGVDSRDVIAFLGAWATGCP